MQIVCIAAWTWKPGLNEIGDVVAIHEDDVELTGKGYFGFEVIKVATMVKSEYEAIVNPKKPTLARAWRVDAKQNTWTSTRPEEKEIWLNSSGKWCDLISRPKYALTLKNLTFQNKLDLANTGISKETKTTILACIEEKIHLDIKNLIEVKDLNA